MLAFVHDLSLFYLDSSHSRLVKPNFHKFVIWGLWFITQNMSIIFYYFAISINPSYKTFKVRLFCHLWICQVCYEDDMCSKYWYARDHLTLGINSRMLSMGVILPPWGNRSLLEVHAQPDVPLSLMKGFMKELQRFAPGLRTAAQNPQETYTWVIIIWIIDT